MALAVALTFGALLAPIAGGQVFAAKEAAASPEMAVCDFEDYSMTDYANQLVAEGIINQSEADRLIENDKKMAALQQEVADIYQKIDSAYEVNYYDELVKNGTLSSAEVEQLKAVDAQINVLYDAAQSDADFAALEAKEQQIYDDNKALFAKVDAYYEAQFQKEIDAEYQAMVDSGQLTAEQVAQLKAADAQANKLFDAAAEELSDEEWAELEQKIDALYEGLDFLEKLEMTDAIQY